MKSIINFSHINLIKPLLIIALLIIGIATLRSEVENNVVITDLVEKYTVSIDKSGTNVGNVRLQSTKKFMATRAPGSATDYVMYDNDFTRVDKAKVKSSGVKPMYHSAISEGIFYDDSKVCIVPVPLETVGKEVETSFDLTYTRPDHEQLFYLSNRYPIKNLSITITFPASLKDHFDIYADNISDNIKINRAIATDGKNVVITISGKDIKANDNFTDTPSARRYFPMIQFKGYFNSIDELYKKFHDYTQSSTGDLNTVASMAQQITEGCDDDYSRVRAVYDWVHENIRYVAIENGDLGQIPDAASNVLEKMYGDCKGSANLIKHLLKSIGIDARLVWIGTNAIPHDWSQRPSMSTGNHMIAAWMMPNDSIVYLDGTVGLCDLGYYPNSIQGKETIIENGDSYILGRIPFKTAGENSYHSILRLHKQGDNVQGTICDNMTGCFKSMVLNLDRFVQPDDRLKSLNNLVKNDRSTWKIDNLITENFTTSDSGAIINGDLNISGAIKKAAGKTFITMDLLPQIKKYLFETKDRTAPGWISTRCKYSTKLYLELENIASIETFPKNIDISTSWFDAKSTYNIDDTNNILEYDIEFTINKHYIPNDDLTQFNTNLKDVIKATNFAISLSN